MTANRRLIYIHDPMCSWCWGFRPTLERLCELLPPGVGFSRLLGGLARDNEQPMPSEMQSKLQDTWRRIQQRIPGTRFNFAFWQDCRPRRSTWPACRAVIAARQFDPALESRMIDAIQRAYYLEARNPSDTVTLVSLAQRLGLDGADFSRRLDAADTRAELEREIALSRQIGADSFPSLRLALDDSYWPIPIDYTEPDVMLTCIQALLED